HSYHDALANGFGKTPHRPQRGAARMPDEQPLRARDGTREVVSGFRGAIPDLVGDARVPDLRNDRGGNVLEALKAMERILGLHGDGADGRVVLFQAPRVAY